MAKQQPLAKDGSKRVPIQIAPLHRRRLADAHSKVPRHKLIASATLAQLHVSPTLCRIHRLDIRRHLQTTAGHDSCKCSSATSSCCHSFRNEHAVSSSIEAVAWREVASEACPYPTHKKPYRPTVIFFFAQLHVSPTLCRIQPPYIQRLGHRVSAKVPLPQLRRTYLLLPCLSYSCTLCKYTLFVVG